ncbi:S-adenosylmethionine synthetase [Cnuella takakiae]|uniref:S-adenosylmethionine synthetase n=1 Tax=Cnuella takakiae TaxID=1302690 RepID=A0A1M4TEG4_9BACT|nr:S-adenosylmethionine synthetase N-terminal domain-containing protein [Cnuella takakiae]OLY90723.1 hypothetical protein BUE76_01525 [Cnuella takakiae]SHE42880.1 S-adenosylmethionine synthetase [Cnuella takakiae]
MKRYSETVLNGHPDKFCDLLADCIVREVYRNDPEGYAQVEASVWSHQLFLTGAIATRNRAAIDVRQLLVELGETIGYTATNHIDASRYQVHDHICRLNADPLQWTRHCNDQSIITGYAGYDGFTNWLPPEHYGAWYFRAALVRALSPGSELAGHGPDGKVLLVLDEDAQGFRLHTLLVTLQQHPSAGYLAFTEQVAVFLYAAYAQLAAKDPRWYAAWKDIRVLINPNGTFIRGGSDSDNGQTGRKLVMDYYGPRIPIGGVLYMASTSPTSTGWVPLPPGPMPWSWYRGAPPRPGYNCVMLPVSTSRWMSAFAATGSCMTIPVPVFRWMRCDGRLRPECWHTRWM